MGATVAVVLLAAAVIGTIVFLGFRMGLFRIENLEDSRHPEDGRKQDLHAQPPHDFPAFPEEADAPEQEDGESGEMMEDLYDYFVEDSEGPVAAGTGDTDAGAPHPLAEQDVEAEFDKLCGFKTGLGFLADCQQALDTAKSLELDMALCYFEFDRFRLINSLMGVSLGDHVLSRIAQQLPVIFPEHSLYSRLSADHFIVLFPLEDRSLIETTAEELITFIDHLRDDIGTKSGLRVCIGYAVTADPSKDYDIGLLVERANTARLTAKVDKSQTLYIFQEGMLATQLHAGSAMEEYGDTQPNDEIVLYYMPVSDITRGRIIGFESLARWSYDDDHYRHIPLTPNNGRLPSNNIKNFYQVCRWMGRWLQTEKDLQLGIFNLPAHDLQKRDLAEYMQRVTESFEVPLKTIVVEISQSAVRLDWSGVSRQLKKLRDIGVKIAVSGINRGTDSLQYLSGLPIDFIKLHRSFVHGVAENPKRSTAIRAMIRSAGELNARTIFEGVDTPAQAELLQLSGAHLIQGNFVGTASTPEEMGNALPDIVSRVRGGTQILDEKSLASGEFKLY